MTDLIDFTIFVWAGKPALENPRYLANIAESAADSIAFGTDPVGALWPQNKKISKST